MRAENCDDEKGGKARHQSGKGGGIWMFQKKDPLGVGISNKVSRGKNVRPGVIYAGERSNTTMRGKQTTTEVSLQ